MSTITRWRGGTLAPMDWPNLSWLPQLGPSIRIEDYLDGDRYVVRAELPGVDPAEDLRVSYDEGQLRLDVVRKEAQRDKTRSEFRYGSYYRLISLPAGVKDDTIVARYANGILEITAKIGEPESSAKEIPIKVENGKKH